MLLTICEGTIIYMVFAIVLATPSPGFRIPWAFKIAHYDTCPEGHSPTSRMHTHASRVGHRRAGEQPVGHRCTGPWGAGVVMRQNQDKCKKAEDKLAAEKKFAEEQIVEERVRADSRVASLVKGCQSSQRLLILSKVA